MLHIRRSCVFWFTVNGVCFLGVLVDSELLDLWAWGMCACQMDVTDRFVPSDLKRNRELVLETLSIEVF